MTTELAAYTQLARKLASTRGVAQGDADVLLRYQDNPSWLGYEATMMLGCYTTKDRIWRMLIDLDNLCRRAEVAS